MIARGGMGGHPPCQRRGLDGPLHGRSEASRSATPTPTLPRLPCGGVQASTLRGGITAIARALPRALHDLLWARQGMGAAHAPHAPCAGAVGPRPYSLIHATKLGKTIRWTVKFAQRSPRILPRWARMLPLRVVALYLELTMKGNHVHRPRWGDTRPSRP